MNLLSKISAAFSLMLAFSYCTAQIKNATTETVKIYGKCEICEATIEKAGNLKKVASVDWNKDSKMATLTYDAKKTNQAEILKRIALAGYDSDQFFAPDDVYAKLPECCLYNRVKKTIAKTEEPKMKMDSTNHSAHNMPMEKQEMNQLKAVFDNYFSLKDALVKSDQKAVSLVAKDLLSNLNRVNMNKLSTEEHTVWMKVMSSLKSNTDKIATSTDVEKQRNAFMALSANMYDFIKVSKQDAPIYYQYCPMYNDGKGSNWLSKESAVKNPYYGSQMLTCGKTVETIK